MLAVVGLTALYACGDGGKDAKSGGPPTNEEQAAECQEVAFTPASEDLAADIRTFGLPCEEAEAFVRAAGPSLGAVGGPDSLDVQGYQCKRTSETQEPIPAATYECTSGSKQIKFTRT